MAIDPKTVERVAKVARINLTEEELKRYSEDLEEILEAFSILSMSKISSETTSPVWGLIQLF